MKHFAITTRNRFEALTEDKVEDGGEEDIAVQDLAEAHSPAPRSLECTSAARARKAKRRRRKLGCAGGGGGNSGGGSGASSSSDSSTSGSSASSTSGSGSGYGVPSRKAICAANANMVPANVDSKDVPGLIDELLEGESESFREPYFLGSRHNKLVTWNCNGGLSRPQMLDADRIARDAAKRRRAVSLFRDHAFVALQEAHVDEGIISVLRAEHKRHKFAWSTCISTTSWPSGVTEANFLGGFKYAFKEVAVRGRMI